MATNRMPWFSRFSRGFVFSVVVAGVASLAGGCGYDCVAECDNIAVLLADEGRNPQTGDIGGMRVEDVCTHPRIQGAEDCRQCVDAMAEIYRFFHAEVGCDCPLDNPTDEERAYPVFAVDAQCDTQQHPYDVEGCLEFEAQQENLQMCF